MNAAHREITFSQNHSTTDGHGWTRIRDLVWQMFFRIRVYRCPSVVKKIFYKMSDSDVVQCKEHKDKKFPFCVLCVLLRPFALVAALPIGVRISGQFLFEISWLL